MERRTVDSSVGDDLVDGFVDADVRTGALIPRQPASAQQAPEPAPAAQPSSTPPSDAQAATAAAGALTDRDRRILAFERHWWRHAGAKERAIRDTFNLSATRYYQLLNALLDQPAALAHDPMLVKRLRRLRATRSRARTRSSGGMSRGA